MEVRFKFFPRVSATSLFAILSLTAVPAPAARIWGVTSVLGSNELVEIDTLDPTAASVSVGFLDPQSNPLGIASTGGQLWIYDTASNLLRQIDVTGVSVATVDLHLTGMVEGDFTFDANGESGFLVSADGSAGTLIRFDIDTNTSVIATNLPLLMGLTLGADGFLYGLAKGVDPLDPGPPADIGLYKIDPLTGASTLVGTTPVIACYDGGGIQLACSVGALTYSGGTLYAVASGVSQSVAGLSYSVLYTIDPLTGEAHAVGQLPFAEVSGLYAETPEPSTLVFTLFALGLLGRFRRR